MFELEVIAWRGSIAESRHRVEVAIADARGQSLGGTAQLNRHTTMRSCAKPFQLVPLVVRGHADRLGLGDEDLAIMAASHSGGRMHVERVQRLLDRIGLGAEALACGWHEPLDSEMLAEVRKHPELRSPLQHNCSGKHAGMLALALAEGWPIAGYEHAEHPVQRLMRETVAEWAGLRAPDLEIAIDGCSATVFALPLSAIATAYARLAGARLDGAAGERALARIRNAMAAHPRLTAGAGRFSTDLMEATRGELISKVGAEGLESVACPARAHGLAVRVEDGANRATPPACLAVLEQLGWLDEAARSALESHRRVPIDNAAGLRVGVLDVELRTLPAAVTPERNFA